MTNEIDFIDEPAELGTLPADETDAAAVDLQAMANDLHGDVPHEQLLQQVNRHHAVTLAEFRRLQDRIGLGQAKAGDVMRRDELKRQLKQIHDVGQV